MPSQLARSRFARLAALAEIILVLALGNIVGVAAYEAIVPAELAEDGALVALYEGLRIFLRIGFVAAFGLALLWFRRGLTPRDAGLTRAGQPLEHLIGIGIVLGGFSSFLIGLVFAVHAIVPLGEGLPAWDEVRDASLDTAFFVNMLATSIIIPPLMEEIMARGYMRVRLVESNGAIGGVVLTGLVFALAHGKFISTDPLLIAFMAILIISSIAWAYVAQLTGSVIPSMVAHAMTNTFATMVLFDVWVPFALITAFVLWQRQPILKALRQFLDDWRTDHQVTGLLFSVVALVLILAMLMFAMMQLGRTTGLLVFGGVALLVTATFRAVEKRQ